ncbi:MAG: hypothetical protein ACE5HS_11430 [bacterium]
MKKIKVDIRSLIKFLLAAILFAAYWYWINQKIISDASPVYGLFGFFLLICACTAFFPLPANLLVLGAVKNNDPLVVAFVAGLGTIGAYSLEYLFFTVLFKFNKVANFKNNWLYQKVAPLFNKHRFFILSFASFLPIPSEPLRIYAITLRYSKILYLLSGFIGKTGRFYLLAYFGKDYVNSLWFLIAVLVSPGIFLFLIRIAMSAWSLIQIKFFAKPLESQVTLPISPAASSPNIGESE